MRIKPVLLSLCAVTTFATGAAHANLITNGDFELTSNGTNKQLGTGTGTTAANRTTLVGWTSGTATDSGYNFVLSSGSMTTNAAAITIKSANNGYTASPDGGNVFASDALYYPPALAQTVNGLVVGSVYTLTFDYALGQQAGFSGVNTDNFWQVSLGGVIQDTTPLSIASGGFSGWQTATMKFTATSASEILSFLAAASAPGAPPFLLLDGVALNLSVPEPSTCSLMLGGLGVLGWLARRRRTQARSA